MPPPYFGFPLILSFALQTVGRKLGMIESGRSLFLKEGITGLYRGFPMAALGAMPGCALYITSYQVLKAKLAPTTGEGFLTDFLAGFGAETLSCCVWVPVDVVKERLQVQQRGGAANYTGTMDALRTIWATEGGSGVYKGYGATLLSFGPYSAFYFLFYEQFRSGCVRYGGYKTRNDLDGSLNLASGAIAGSLAAFLTNPLDLVKLRLQVQRSGHGGREGRHASGGLASGGGVVPGGLSFGYKGVLDGIITIYRQEGPKVRHCILPCPYGAGFTTSIYSNYVHIW